MQPNINNSNRSHRVWTFQTFIKIVIGFFFSPFFFKNAYIPRRLGLPLAPVTKSLQVQYEEEEDEDAHSSFGFFILLDRHILEVFFFFSYSSSGIPHSRKGNVEKENLLTHS